MQCFLWLAMITISLMLSGCESPEQPSNQTAANQVVEQDKPSRDKQAEQIPAVAGSTVETAKEVVKQVEKEAAEAKVAVEEQAVAAADKAESVTKQVVAEVQKKSSAVAEAVQTATSPVTEEIILEASYGTVTFPHAVHADSYACSACHGEGTPAAFGINKEIAHELCKGCHKSEGSGPTGCSGCHKK